MTSPDAAPIACTLSPASQSDRFAEIATLVRDGLIGHRRDGLWLELDFREPVRKRVERMVEQERACCGFLDFALAQTGDVIRVTIVAPEAAREASETIFDAFLGRQPRSSGCGCC